MRRIILLVTVALVMTVAAAGMAYAKFIVGTSGPDTCLQGGQDDAEGSGLPCF